MDKLKAGPSSQVTEDNTTNNNREIPSGGDDAENDGSSQAKSFQFSNVRKRLTKSDLQKIQDIIKEKHPDLGGLISDFDLQYPVKATRLDFNKRIVQVLNTAYFKKGHHWCLIVKDPGQNFQLYDSDIESRTSPYEVDIPSTIKMKLAYVSQADSFSIYILNTDDILGLYAGCVMEPTPQHRRIVIRPFCHKCDLYTMPSAEAVYLCDGCQFWFHEMCRPKVKAGEMWRCVICEQTWLKSLDIDTPGTKSNESWDLSQRNNSRMWKTDIQEVINSKFRTRTSLTKTLLYDVNIGKDGNSHPYLTVKFHNIPHFLIYNYEKQVTETLSLSHDMEIAMVYLCWPHVIQNGGVNIEVMKCTQQSNEYDCGVFTALNAIHWSSQGTIPSDYLQGKSSEELRDMFADFIDTHGNSDKIPMVVSKRDITLGMITLIPTCKTSYCRYTEPVYLPEEVDMFKCFICLQWYHYICGQPERYESVYRMYCHQCAEFWMLTDQTPDTNISNTEAQNYESVDNVAIGNNRNDLDAPSQYLADASTSGTQLNIFPDNVVDLGETGNQTGNLEEDEQSEGTSSRSGTPDNWEDRHEMTSESSSDSTGHSISEETQ